jgi:hypothetical protein
MLAAIRLMEADLEFAEGHALDDRQAAMVPALQRDRLLSLCDAHQLTVRFERRQRWEPRSNRMRLAVVEIENAAARQIRE